MTEEATKTQPETVNTAALLAERRSQKLNSSKTEPVVEEKEEAPKADTKTKTEAPAKKADESAADDNSVEYWKNKAAAEEKRRKDAQKALNERDQKLKSKVADGAVDEEVARDLANNAAAMSDNPYGEIMAQAEAEVTILAKYDEHAKDHYNAFWEYLRADPAKADEVAEELLALPADQVAKFILKVGKEFADDVYGDVAKHGGPYKAVKAIKAEAAQREADLQAENEKLRKKLEALGEKPVARPNLRSSAPADTEPQDTGPVSTAQMLQARRAEKLKSARR